MPKILYRPLGNQSRQSSTSAWATAATSRNSMAFAIVVCLVIVYVIWISSSSSTQSGNLAATSLHHHSSMHLMRYSRDENEFMSAVSRISAAAAAAGGSSSAHHRSKDTSNYIVNDTSVVCSENFSDTRQFVQNRPISEFDGLPTIYFITPTYPRREQIPELTRLAHTLMHVPKIHWIVADDFAECNIFLGYLFNKFGIPFTHISSPMPDIYRSLTPNPRGVANRRAALNWLRQQKQTSGVLYFGDDDNTFDLKLFSEIRDTKKVSMFPVGLIGMFSVSTPVVQKGKVIGFFDSWPGNRRWPVDMAGFAVNLEHFANHPNATMPYKAGYEEDSFLRSISLSLKDIEPKANNCTEILVWHTQTQKTKAPTIRINSQYLDDKSSLGLLFKELEIMGVSHASDYDGVKATITKNGKTKPISYYLR
ncbi:galactosylgalactosylxylosylprotein 3-beta-glucuronosyltransferase S isoform X1 [Eupeodes corollae]|uniref:galactosylgalactosylxylosylprotein 3-beta-glucuronosyltransferase S isoform X1 n=1 Tax=Eupeodes corollae TaxID=290404 RepID=UPI002492960D|nr:galactosylgalactosylxylosylprotein 3-beta-glucuronosyltransferase S isoform X1 [Eupeodes corollae]